MAYNNSTPMVTNTGPPFQLVVRPYNICLATGASFCVVANLFIIIATLRSEALKNKCSYLIALLAAADFTTSATFVHDGVSKYITDIDRLAMPNDICAYSMILMTLSLGIGNAMVLIVGVDRYFCVRFPAQYSNHLLFSKRIYVPLMFGVSVLFSISQLVFMFLYLSPHEMVLICIPPTAYRSVAFSYWVISNLVLNVFVVAVYIIAYQKIKKQNDNSQTQGNSTANRKRFMKSLLLVMLVYIGTYCLTYVILFVTGLFNFSPSVQFHASLYAGLLVTANLGSNAVIYGFRSKEYGKEFRKLLCCGFVGSNGSSSSHVTPITQVQSTK